MTELGEFGKYLATGAALLALFLGPIGSALARRLMGHQDAEREAREAELEARVAELEGQLQGLQELSERLDFAERLLAQREAGGLPRSALQEEGAG